jgi:hypothetical protein
MGLRSRASTTAKIEEAAAIPRASVAVTATVKPGRARIPRIA